MKGTSLLLVFLLGLALMAGVYVSTIPIQAAPRASPSIRYVAPGGSDTSNDCLTQGTPCATIQYAIDVSVGTSVTVSDTVQLAEGPYTGNVLIPVKKYLIIQGNSGKQATTIINGTITMQGSQLGLNNVTVTGSGANGGGLIVSTPATTTVYVRNSIFLNNTATGNGGAIYNGGNLTIIRSQFQGNSAAAGGAIYNASGASATIIQSAVVTNTGSAIVNAGSLALTNSTVGGNTGDGITSSGGTLGLYNATVAHNSANGVNITGGSATIQNSIMSGNATDCSGTGVSGGNNDIPTGGCGFTGGTNQNSDPLLGPLALNHGPNLNYLPGAGSPAIDHGVATGCLDGQGNLLTSDQRGEVRPQNGGLALQCDIGSVELGDAPILTSINPDTIAAGSSDFTMVLTGNWHQTNAVALWISQGGGITTTITPTLRTATQMTVTIPGSLVIFPGTANVAVQNPGVSGGAASNSVPMPFAITGSPPNPLYLPLIERH